MRRLTILLVVIAAPALAYGDAADDDDKAADAKAKDADKDDKDAPKKKRPLSDVGDEPEPPRTTQMCIDQEIADRLAIKRKRRGAVDRLFVKQERHELTLNGGYYASDLFSGTYIAGGAYTYHMTDGTAVEFAASYTHANADVIRAIEDRRGQALADTYDRVIIAESLLIMSPIYGKLRLGGSIVHFDVHVDLGVGVVDSETSRGSVGVAGAGFKLFGGKAFAFRLDIRNRTYRQELLDERFLVNDTSLTAGVSMFVPFRN